MRFHIIISVILVMLYIPFVPSIISHGLLMGFTLIVFVVMSMQSDVESNQRQSVIGVLIGALLIGISLYFWNDVVTLFSMPSMIDATLAFNVGAIMCLLSMLKGYFSGPQFKKHREGLWKGGWGT